jgi:type I restriction enzyme S subunit
MTKQLTIGEVCDFVGGSQPPKSTFKYEPGEGYVRLIQTRDYKTDSFVTYIPEKRTKKFCTATDIMIGRYGPPIFQICRGLEGAYNVALMKAVPKDNIKLDYLYYFLKQNSVFEYVDKLSVRTGGQTGVDLDCLRKYPVKLPSIEKQTQIAAVLSALDAKIALNHRINSELEGMAKLLYDYWFVQYDFPLSAAQATALGKPHLTGHPYRSSGGPMVYHTQLKREIPKGWEVKSLCEIESNIITGKTPPTSDPANFAGDIPFICIGDVRGNMHIVKTELTLSSKGAAIQQNKFIPKGAICVTCIASPGLVAFATRDSQTNQQLNSIVCEKEEHRPFLYFYLKDYFINSAGAKTGNTFANMNKGDFSSIPVVTPEFSIIKLFSEKVEPIFSLVLTNQQQNQELTTLRDWLLPMLMNGQVRVTAT